MRNQKKPVPVNPPIADIENLSSVTECTGLTPSAVLTEGQAEDYSRLYAIHSQKRNTIAAQGVEGMERITKGSRQGEEG